MLKLMPLLFAAALLYATPISAGGEVPDDSYYSFGSSIVHFDVTQNPNDSTKVDTTVTDASGFSSPEAGTAGPSSTASDPTALSSGKMTTPGGDEYTISGGRAWKKNSHGVWVPGKKTKKPKSKGNGKRAAPAGNIGGTPGSPGDDVNTLPGKRGHT
jgi:hypothetical protein